MTTDSKARKETPMFSGVLLYFPDALAAVARLSFKGNEKHNPGEPLHWAREKSTDHGDCIVRHQIAFDQIDPENGEYHAVAVAWRALAQLQLLEEKRLAEQAEPLPDGTYIGVIAEDSGYRVKSKPVAIKGKYDGDWNFPSQGEGFWRVKGDSVVFIWPDCRESPSSVNFKLYIDEGKFVPNKFGVKQ